MTMGLCKHFAEHANIYKAFAQTIVIINQQYTSQRVKFISCIYIVYMCLDCVLSIVVFEIAE